MKEKIALYIVVKNLYYDLFLINGEMGTKINGFFCFYSLLFYYCFNNEVNAYHELIFKRFKLS